MLVCSIPSSHPTTQAIMDVISLDSPVKQSPQRAGFAESRTSVPYDDSSRTLGRGADSLSLRIESQVQLGSESTQSILRHGRPKSSQAGYRASQLHRSPYSYSTVTPEYQPEKGERKWTQFFRRGAPTCDLDVPLEPWRKALITFALAAAGFLVSPNCYSRDIKRRLSDYGLHWIIGWT